MDSKGNIIICSAAAAGGPISEEMTKLSITWADNAATLNANINYRVTLINVHGNYFCSKPFRLDDFAGLAQPVAYTNGTANALFVEFKATRNLSLSEFKIWIPANKTNIMPITHETPITVLADQTTTIRLDIQTPIASGTYTAALKIEDAGFYVIAIDVP